MAIYTVPPWVDVPDPNNPPAGAIAITAAQLQALGQAILDAVLDLDNLPGWLAPVVRQDPVTGNWPGDWNTPDGSPNYATGSTTVFVRPTARNIPVLWFGWTDPAILTGGTGTGGFRQGLDLYWRIATGS